MAQTGTKCDLLIVGGGTGGVAAALAACSRGLRVVMTEPTDWVGGQLTSQAVPPDEHPWIEQFGCTARYRAYRDGVRRFYADHTPLSPEARANRRLDPGGGWVSRLCHEPRIGWLVLCQMLQPALASGLLDLRLWTVPSGAEVDGDRVRSVLLFNRQTGREELVEPKYVLDATETGELLPMTGTEYVLGAESKRQTGEPNALDGDPEPENVQGATWIAALGYDAKGEHVIEKPREYDKWHAWKPNGWPGPLLSFDVLHVQKGTTIRFPLFSDDWYNLFSYRQVIRPETFAPGAVTEPVTIANWPQNDYYEHTVLDVPADALERRLESARQLTLSFIYWLQTEAPCHDGGVGYPGLRLRPDVTDTPDGLAKYPYIRESRRIQARFTVLEQHVAAAANEGRVKAEPFWDSVGVGAYRIDLHPSSNGRPTIDAGSLPFQIPLGALLPVRMRNLLPACKNLGVTHITNGCYRLHPVEWNIGESAALLAAHCLRNGLEPAQVYEDREKVAAFQQELLADGVEIDWPQLRAL